LAHIQSTPNRVSAIGAFSAARRLSASASCVRRYDDGVDGQGGDVALMDDDAVGHVIKFPSSMPAFIAGPTAIPGRSTIYRACRHRIRGSTGSFGRQFGGRQSAYR